MYHGLATVLIRGRTPIVQKSAVKTLMRSKWMKWEHWNPKEDAPLDEREFNRLMFLLAHLVDSCIQRR
jgi:hypothetical protein